MKADISEQNGYTPLPIGPISNVIVQISLYALEGTQLPHNITNYNLLVFTAEGLIYVLIDCTGTHNLMDAGLARALD